MFAGISSDVADFAATLLQKHWFVKAGKQAQKEKEGQEGGLEMGAEINI